MLMRLEADEEYGSIVVWEYRTFCTSRHQFESTFTQASDISNLSERSLPCLAGTDRGQRIRQGTRQGSKMIFP